MAPVHVPVRISSDDDNRQGELLVTPREIQRRRQGDEAFLGNGEELRGPQCHPRRKSQPRSDLAQVREQKSFSATAATSAALRVVKRYGAARRRRAAPPVGSSAARRGASLESRGPIKAPSCERCQGSRAPAQPRRVCPMNAPILWGGAHQAYVAPFAVRWLVRRDAIPGGAAARCIRSRDGRKRGPDSACLPRRSFRSMPGPPPYYPDRGAAPAAAPPRLQRSEAELRPPRRSGP